MKVSYTPQEEVRKVTPLVTVTIEIETASELRRWETLYKMIFDPQAPVPLERSFSISVFTPGDIITRIEPSSTGDTSYRGQPMRYIGIENNNIVVVHMSGVLKNIITKLPIPEFMLGWGLYKGML